METIYDIKGWGADRRTEDRPGVPRERQPAPWPGAQPPPQQRDGAPPVHAERRTPTPVFGGLQPPHGLSGRLRNAAYRIPNHKAHHWMLLLLADRVDVMETNLRDLVKRRGFVALLATVGALGLAAGGIAIARARK